MHALWFIISNIISIIEFLVRISLSHNSNSFQKIGAIRNLQLFLKDAHTTRVDRKMCAFTNTKQVVGSEHSVVQTTAKNVFALTER